MSGKFTLDKTDFKQIGIKILMGVVAVAIPVIISNLSSINFGTYQPVVTMIIFILQYIGQRFLQGT